MSNSNNMKKNSVLVTQKTEIVETTGTSVVIADAKTIRSQLKDLDNAFNAVEKTFFKIGALLYWFYDTQAFTQIDGKAYHNISDFAKERYNISKATTYQFINVMKKFGKQDESGNLVISDIYKQYSSTQLIEMEKMNDDTLQKCTPEMKIKELKELAKAQNDICSDSCEDTKPISKPTESEVVSPSESENIIEIPPMQLCHTQKLFSVCSISDFEKRQTEIINCIKEKLIQNTDGVLIIQYESAK